MKAENSDIIVRIQIKSIEDIDVQRDEYVKKTKDIIHQVNMEYIMRKTMYLPCVDDVNAAELEEMWSFAKCKANQRWLWLAIDHDTREVLAYTFGRREDVVFLRLWSSYVKILIQTNILSARLTLSVSSISLSELTSNDSHAKLSVFRNLSLYMHRCWLGHKFLAVSIVSFLSKTTLLIQNQIYYLKEWFTLRIEWMDKEINK